MADHALSRQAYHPDSNWNDMRITAGLRKVFLWVRDITHSVRYSRRRAHGITSQAMTNYHRAVARARRWKRSVPLFRTMGVLTTLSMMATTASGIYNTDNTMVGGSMLFLPIIGALYYGILYAEGHSRPSRHRRGEVRPVW